MRSYVIAWHLMLTLLVFAPECAVGQFTFIEDQTIPVKNRNGNLLSNAWTGGLNAVQFNTMDFNMDGDEDLVLFDRMANMVMPFLQVEGQYRYAPEYTVLFPGEITNWLLLRDFNCDGKKDIFTGDIMGAKVYTNTSNTDDGLSWERFLFYVPGVAKSNIILTKGSTRKNNLQMQYDDLPAVVDADGDGDMDIFSIRYGGYGMAEFHKNFSMERYGVCDSLDFERVNNWYGGFTQCKCEDFAFNKELCSSQGGRLPDETSGRVKHAAGKALLTLDVDGDTDQEIIFSEAGCDNLYMLTNKGTIENPLMDVVELFPATDAVQIRAFPAAFWEDVDFDGIKDLIASPNSFQKEFYYNTDYKESIWMYKNLGSNELPDFQFVKKSFLQEDMIEVGDNAVPAFMDADGDGDEDLFIGYSSGETLLSGLYYFENTGSGFQLVTENYNNFASLGFYNVKPQFVDVNGDRKSDLVFSGTNNTTQETSIHFLINTADNGFDFSFDDLQTIDIVLSFNENYHLTSIDLDDRIDLLVGRFTGSIEYWRNNGSTSSPQFYLESDEYLNFSSNVIRQNIAMSTADLNNDGKQDLIISDQTGQIGIFNDFHEAKDISEEITDIVLNPLTNEYHPTFLGRVWPTTAMLFDSKRPAIIAGTVRGGLQVFRNEDKQLQFEELILSVYPNPSDGIITIKTNIQTKVQVFSSIGQQVTQPSNVNVGTTTVEFPDLSAGMYVLRFFFDDKTVHRRLIIK